MATESGAAPGATPAVGVGGCAERIWSMSLEERYRRAVTRAGGTYVGALADALALRPARVVLFRLDHVLDEQLIGEMLRLEDVVLTDSAGILPVAVNVAAAAAPDAAALLAGDRPATLDGLRRLTPRDATSAYRNALRKRSDPYALALTADSRRDIEWRMFMAAYKGATDFVTKFFWPPIAVHATRWAAARGISPNAITWLSFGFVLLTTWLFANGWFVTGCFSAWMMTFLDTVDGKLARVTLTSSKLGEFFDHGIDHVHPPFWYWAWVVGLRESGLGLESEALILWIVIGGYLLGRAQEGFFLWRYKIEIHIWQRLDTLFRLFTARRNPNVFILMVCAMFGRSDYGIVAVAVWTVLSLAFHFLRIAQAEAARRRDPIRSWLADPPREQAV